MVSLAVTLYGAEAEGKVTVCAQESAGPKRRARSDTRCTEPNSPLRLALLLAVLTERQRVSARQVERLVATLHPAARGAAANLIAPPDVEVARGPRHKLKTFVVQLASPVAVAEVLKAVHTVWLSLPAQVKAADALPRSARASTTVRR